MLASFIEQASFSPPMISVAMGRDRPMREVLDGSGVFGLHVLGKNNGPLVKTFSRPGAGDPFEGHALLDNVHAIPRLADAWAFLVCTVRNSMAAGDHILYLAEVMDGSLHDSKDEPMVRVRQNGFGY